MTPRRIGALAGAVALVGALGLALWLTPDDGPEPQPVRARQYAATQACLLTDQQGVAAPGAADVWGAMQDSSAATSAKVSSLPVIGEQSVGNAVPYANTLVARKCDVLLATGTVEVQALTRIAPANPNLRFLLVGEAPAAGNVTVIPPGPQARTKVGEALTAALTSGKQ
ncbi:BMP family ABC transporter substrate-binding protein [Kitasatospora sp. NPDC097643]|uniref:BMP family ABC transporter substrate-binding protein n=1 Tax=Kitasatospora sp. NPDC097643 TaxID=3157230 RepID=UPI00332E8BF7